MAPSKACTTAIWQLGGKPDCSLTHLIDSMRDEQGRILIKGFYDNVRAPTAAEKERSGESRMSRLTPPRISNRCNGRKRASRSTNCSCSPAFNVRGIEAGHVGKQASNTIPTEARASIDFRLVPTRRRTQ